MIVGYCVAGIPGIPPAQRGSRDLLAGGMVIDVLRVIRTAEHAGQPWGSGEQVLDLNELHAENAGCVVTRYAAGIAAITN